MRGLLERLAGQSTVVDFEELILLESTRANTRLWKQDDVLIGFAYVDEFNNLWFDVDTTPPWLDAMEAEIVAWGVECIRRRNAETGEQATLDCSCRADNPRRLAMLQAQGFALEPVRSLSYERSLAAPVSPQPLPPGFSIRPAHGTSEVEALVALHRAAFGTENMTVEQRLAMMNAPHYIPELDLLAIAPGGELAAFCVCGFETPDHSVGYTDPIGVHPAYQKRGLGLAVVTIGLDRLQRAGAKTATLGTSSENAAMQALAGKAGFACVSEKLWLSKSIAAG
jgi:ribosomal protein S18 acetylase RimI-like enzyme